MCLARTTPLRCCIDLPANRTDATRGGATPQPFRTNRTPRRSAAGCRRAQSSRARRCGISSLRSVAPRQWPARTRRPRPRGSFVLVRARPGLLKYSGRGPRAIDAARVATAAPTTWRSEIARDGASAPRARSWRSAGPGSARREAPIGDRIGSTASCAPFCGYPAAGLRRRAARAAGRLRAHRHARARSRD